MTQDERTRAKKRELLEIYGALPENELKAASDLIDNAAFLSVTLEDLQEDIKKNGVTEIYTNGEHQQGRKQSSAVKAYNSLMSKYVRIMSELLKRVPETKKIRRETPEGAMLGVRAAAKPYEAPECETFEEWQASHK